MDDAWGASRLFDLSDENAWVVPVDDYVEEETAQAAIGSSNSETVNGLEAVTTARGFSSGRAAARIVMGNGRHQLGAGNIMKDVDFRPTCITMLDDGISVEDRLVCIKAIANLAQVQSNANKLREAGAVSACVALLDAGIDARLANAAADAIRHLACASQPNRIAAREAGAIPRLVAMLTRVADATGRDDSKADRAGHEGGITHAHYEGTTLSRQHVAAVTAATAALRNLSFQNGPKYVHRCLTPTTP